MESTIILVSDSDTRIVKSNPTMSRTKMPGDGYTTHGGGSEVTELLQFMNETANIRNAILIFIEKCNTEKL